MAVFLIGERTYRTKSAALDAIREVRERVKAQGSASAADDEFLRDLVALHPDAEGKVGAGIDHFEVRRNINNDGFWIVRVDGTATEFSFMKSIYGASQEAMVQSAMRHAVLDQKMEARDLAFTKATSLTCPLTGEVITAVDCHMDHEEPTFAEIADAFTAAHGGYSAMDTPSDDGTIGRRFVDQNVMLAWHAFHASRARLRPVSRRANLSVLRRGVPRKPRG
jgi:hypothetical protein